MTRKVPGKNIEDFCTTVRRALKEPIGYFYYEHSSDTSLDLAISSKPVIIKPYAFYESESKYNSLEFILRRSTELHREIPFVGIIDEQNLVVSEFIKGKIGDAGVCDWDEGPLLKKAYKKASKLNSKVSLGHTHPSGFGAVCSSIGYTKKELKECKDDEVAKWMLETEMYEEHGADYCLMLYKSQNVDLISTYCWIMSPGFWKGEPDQIGVFEVKEKGKIVYHPWKII